MYYYLITNFGNMAAIQKSIVCLYALRIWKRELSNIVLLDISNAQRKKKVGRHVSRVWPAIVGVIVAGGWGARIQAPWDRSRHSNVSGDKFHETGRNDLRADYGVPDEYATLQHTMVFIALDLLLANLYVTSYIAMLNARKSMSDREASSIDVSIGKVMRSGMGVRSDTLKMHSMSIDGKLTPDGIPLSEAKFAPSFPNKHDRDPERGLSSKQHVGVRDIHSTELRHETTTAANDSEV
ncbi:hypothetical protein M413DRAFT_13243 [Hebeloma cylindrosporum]|uniref:Uncharacterized protein n=1 Tax=Hebeloma cylindrosporum TaxID=76867 RepID=A0A0C3C1F9_HEBCY|nr:hypothetical protein M413DRAFT_13243 [Hebeloma cylindrosporum h7]